MLRKLPFLFVLLLYMACIPIKRTATTNSGGNYNLYKMRDPGGKEYAYMFRDFQRKDKFTEFLMYKYNLKRHQTKGYIPVEINGGNFYLIYDRFEEEEVTLNLLPILLSNTDDDNESDNYTLEDDENDISKDFTLSEKYDFVTIKVYDSDFNNALVTKSLFVNIAKEYMQKLKAEYKQFIINVRPY